MERTLHLGYFEDFKGENTLLFEGSAQGLTALSGVFQALAGGSLSDVALHELPFVVAHGVNVVATRAAKGECVQLAGRRFLWSQSLDGWQTSSQLVEPLVQAGAGHQYLAASLGQPTVMVSTGEYGASFWDTGA